METLGDTINYELLHDEYLDLRFHQFERIKIRMSDLRGILLNVDYDI